MKKLYRSTIDKRIGGVCGGLAEYTDSDPTIWRILFLALIFAPFPTVLFYLLACIVIPKNKTL
jgi:phage shock protein C